MSDQPREPVILHVEDDVDHAELVRRCLSKHRPESRIVRVEDGDAAIAYLSAHANDKAARPLLILLDLRLPKRDGFEVLRKLKTTPEFAAIPVVVLTTSNSEVDVVRAYEQHVNSYLVKPDDFVVLESMMRDLGNYWLDWNVQPSEGP